MMNRIIRILLVEDEEAHIELVSRAFDSRRQNMQFMVAKSLKKAKDQLTSFKPDVLIADWLLPDGNGIDLLPADQENPPFPTIIMTSHGNEKFAVEAIKAGAIDYVVKSIETLADMPHIVDRCLREWEHINQRKITEFKLKESEERYRALFDNSPNLLAQFNGEGRFLAINPAMAQSLGLDQNDIIDKKITEIIPGEVAEFRRSMISKALKEWQTLTFEDVRNRRYFHSTYIPTRLKEGDICQVIVKEITKTKLYSEELKAYNEKLKQRNRELQDFAYVVSHDLQEPLRNVLEYIKRLIRDYSELLDEQGNGYLFRIQKASKRMQTLVFDLLTYSRINTKTQSYNEIKLTQILRGVLFDLEIRLEETGGRVEFGQLPSIEADLTQMHQLFHNLVNNALKYHRPGIPPIIKVYGQFVKLNRPESINSPAESDFCKIMVEDNGLGIEEKHLDRIFDIFQRLNHSAKNEGTGIGLAICRKIVERHRGSISVQSVVGKGSTFIIHLPLKQPSQNS